MKQKSFFVAILSFFFVSIPSFVFAVTCSSGYVARGGVCFPSTAATGLSDASVESLLMNLMNWLFGIFGFIGIIAFVISGLQYLTAAGDEKQADTAKNNMKYSVIGIIVALSGFIVIQSVDLFLRGSSYF